MSIPSTVYTVTEARTHLPELLRQVKDRGAVFIGVRRNPEAVLQSVDTYRAERVPAPVLRSMLAEAAVGAAELLRRGEPVRGRALHPGDPVGRIVAWTWLADPGRCMVFLADLIAELRDHQPKPITPKLRLSDLLAGLAFALPGDFPEYEKQALLARAALEVPKMYGADPNA